MKLQKGQRPSPFHAQSLKSKNLTGRRVFMGLLTLLLIGVVWLRRHLDDQAAEAYEAAAKAQWAMPGDWQSHTLVEITGMVEIPGVYRLEAGQKLGDLMKLSRAYAPDGEALPTQWNQVELSSGDRVKIAWGEYGAHFELGEMAPAKRLLFGMKFDVNQAGVDAFQAIPGIGPALAESIVAHRTENGPFQALSDLEAIRGIGPKKVAQFEEYLIVSPPQTRENP